MKKYVKPQIYVEEIEQDVMCNTSQPHEHHHHDDWRDTPHEPRDPWHEYRYWTVLDEEY